MTTSGSRKMIITGLLVALFFGVPILGIVTPDIKSEQENDFSLDSVEMRTQNLPSSIGTTSNCSMLGLGLNDIFSFESYVDATQFHLGPDHHDFTLISIQRENLSADLWMTDGVDMNLLVEGISTLHEYYQSGFGFNYMADFNEENIFYSTRNLAALHVIGILGDEVIFSVRNSLSLSITETALWRTDGTAEGTTMFFSDGGDTNRTVIGGGNGYYGEFSLELDGYLYFGDSVDTSNRLWRTDGSADGTEVVSLSHPSIDSSQSTRIQNFKKTSEGLVLSNPTLWLVNHTFNPVPLSTPYWLNLDSQTWDLVETNSQFFLYNEQFISVSSSIFNLNGDHNGGYNAITNDFGSAKIINDNVYVIRKQCYDSDGNSVSACNNWPGQDYYDATFSIELWRYSATGWASPSWNIPELVSNITHYIERNLPGLNNYPNYMQYGHNSNSINIQLGTYDNKLIIGTIAERSTFSSDKYYYFYAESDILNNTTSSLSDDTSHLWSHFYQTGIGGHNINHYYYNQRAPYLFVTGTHMPMPNYPYVLNGHGSSGSMFADSSIPFHSYPFDGHFSISSNLYENTVVVNNRILLFAYDWYTWPGYNSNYNQVGIHRNITGNVTALVLDYWDYDQDGICNYEDSDDDNDGWSDYDDAFPRNPDEHSDTDWDGIGDNEDTDDDGDGYNDSVDAFPLISWEWIDTDDDGTGDNSDSDDDDDGWGDYTEYQCDTDSLDVNSIPLDTDGDMTCNKFDDDDDGDGFNDTSDIFPLDYTEWNDNDEDGIGDNSDDDDDDDGTPDSIDAFPLDSTEQSDTDGDGIGDNLDTDDDGDYIADIDDFCPRGDTDWISGAALGTDYDGDGCRDDGEDIDDDGDGVEDIFDSCPRGHLGWLSNQINDIDADGCYDSVELFPNDPSNGDSNDREDIFRNEKSDDRDLITIFLIGTLLTLIILNVINIKNKK